MYQDLAGPLGTPASIPGAPAGHPNLRFLAGGLVPCAHGHRVTPLLLSSPQQPADLTNLLFFTRGAEVPKAIRQGRAFSQRDGCLHDWSCLWHLGSNPQLNYNIVSSLAEVLTPATWDVQIKASACDFTHQKPLLACDKGACSPHHLPACVSAHPLPSTAGNRHIYAQRSSLPHWAANDKIKRL